jgi:hypothetical protein
MELRQSPRSRGVGTRRPTAKGTAEPGQMVADIAESTRTHADQGQTRGESDQVARGYL